MVYPCIHGLAIFVDIQNQGVNKTMLHLWNACMQDVQTFRVEGSLDCPYTMTKWAVWVNKFGCHTPGLATPGVTTLGFHSFLLVMYTHKE